LRFRLTYRGPLAANGNPNQKFEIRKKFHPQLTLLMDQEPLTHSFQDPDFSRSISEQRGQITYRPLISEKSYTYVELDILMLRPGVPGFILGGGGDIDNRLKTLFDSLQPPNLSDNTTFTWENGIPMNCLLQDDKLITRVNVETDRILDGNPQSNYVELVIRAHVRASSPRECNHFAS
jgi:hypothetical protein